jgi:hypothetical protein
MRPWLKEQRIEVLHNYDTDIVLIGELPGMPREPDVAIDFMVLAAGNTRRTPKMQKLRRHTLPELKLRLALKQGLVTGTMGWTTTFPRNQL